MRNFYRKRKQNKKKEYKIALKKCEAFLKVKKNENEISSFNKCDEKYTLNNKFIAKTIINRITFIKNCKNFK